MARSASHGSLHGSRSFAVHNAAGNLSGRNAAIRSNAVHTALASHAFARALHNPSALHNPGTRALITATAATAGWHHFHNGGWWGHGNGGFGWVGPLFWPFAFYDIYDYSLWGWDPFWWYGYGDLYAGIFAPYGYDDLLGYMPTYGDGYAYGGYGGRARTAYARGPAEAPSDELAQMCGEDSREVAGLPIDRIQQAIQPSEEQRTALDDLANASVRAAQVIKAACPTKIVSTAPARLAAMQSRLEAMIQAVNVVQPPLDRFWGLLGDEQKSRLSSLGQSQRNDRRGDRNAEGSLGQACGGAQSGATNWPTAELEQRLHPTDAQRASLDNLKDASAKAADMLKSTCTPDDALTPPTRLAAVGKRLDTMLQAIETVKSALDDVYKDLTDEQKAQFEAIGPDRTAAFASDDSGSTSGRHYRRRHHASIGGIVRRLISFGF